MRDRECLYWCATWFFWGTPAHTSQIIELKERHEEKSWNFCCDIEFIYSTAFIPCAVSSLVASVPPFSVSFVTIMYLRIPSGLSDYLLFAGSSNTNTLRKLLIFQFQIWQTNAIICMNIKNKRWNKKQIPVVWKC